MLGREGNSLVGEATFLVGGFLATMVARKVINVVWVAASGKAVPDDPGDPKVSTGEAVAFAVLTGALVGVAKLLVQRKANTVKANRVRARAAAVA
jgi:hypothetical protein